LVLARKALQNVALKIYRIKIEDLREELMKENNETFQQIYELEAFK
jgi:hypothetical protein